MSLVVIATSSQHWLSYETSTRQKIKLHRKLSPTLLKNTLSEACIAMLLPVLLGLSLRAELCTGQDHVYPTQQWGIHTVFLQLKDQQKFTL